MSSARWQGLGDRVRVAGFLVVVSFTLIFWGVWPFFLEAALMVTAGLSEFFDMVERKGLRPARRSGTVMALALLTASAMCREAALFQVYLACLLGFLLLMVMRATQRKSLLLDTASTWMGVSYLGLFSFVMLLRQQPQGAWWVILLALLCVVTDSGAYFVGRIFGRHKLCPHISPKKTWEGSLGGLAAAGALMGWVAQRQGWSVPHAVWVGALVSVSGQVGDLWESALKREVGVKDSGDLLGGHGGVLDRFDSLAFAAPTFYFAAHWMGWI